MREELTNWVENVLIPSLPHGAGIDADWVLEKVQRNRKIVLACAYHGMNERGYYDGWQAFKVALDPYNPKDFKVTLSSEDQKYNQHKDWFYGLRDYLDETLYYTLRTIPPLK